VNQGDLGEIGVIISCGEEVDFLVARVDKLGVFLLAGRTSSSSAACGFGWPNLPPQSRVTWLGVYRSGHPYWPSSFGGWTIPLEAACSSSLLAELSSSCSSVLVVVLRGRNKGGRG
jgi:hypothetical protein